MKVRITDTDLDGKPLQGEGEIFAGKTALEVVRAMRGAALFSDQSTLGDYLDMLLRNAKMLSGIDLIVKGDTPEEKADSLLASLVDHGLAEFLEDEPPKPITVPAAVWQGLESVRRSGLTNMFDRPAVIQIAERLDFLETARWIEGHHGPYSEGLFKGFVVDPEEGKL